MSGRPVPVRALTLGLTVAVAVAVVAASGAAASVGFVTASTAAAPVAQPPGPDQSAGTVTYRLEQTLSGAPWNLTAGRYGNVGDISSAPDGTQYLLDTRHPAIHILNSRSVPIRVFTLPTPEDDGAKRTWYPTRLDTGFDGVAAVLSVAPPGRNVGFGHVDLFDAQGAPLGGFAMSAQNGQFTDVAIGPEGAIYVTRAPLGGIFAGDGSVGVDVYARDGRILEQIEDPHLTFPNGVDVAANGLVYVINMVPVPSAGPPPDPGPTATPYPSFDGRPGRVGILGGVPADADGRRRLAAAPDQAVQAIEGIVIFDAGHGFFDQVPFVNAEDVAVGPAGIFVARQLEIFALGEAEPIFSGATGRIYAAYFGRAALHLDVPTDGRLLAGVAHCYFQGVMTFDSPAARPAEPWLLGGTDAPELEGPPFPIRIAADGWLGALEGRFTVRGSPGPNRIYETLYHAQELQTVQRWTADGRLVSQLGLCSGTEAYWVKDVAIDGDTVYTVDPLIVQSRPADGFPAWRYWPGQLWLPDDTSRLVAIGADAGRVAVLDQGSGKVVVLDEAGNPLYDWSWRGSIPGLPTDLALRQDQVFVLDAGAKRVYRFDIDGTARGSWPVNDAPLALDVGPEGDVFVLGRGGWGLRYAPDGKLVAAWRLPDLPVQARDIAVGADGRVRVNYVRFFQTSQDSYEIINSGIWVFGPVSAPERPATPDASACLAWPDKTAAPDSIPLGDKVKVTLTVAGTCPGTYDPVQMALVLDVSRSMNWEDAKEQALDAGLGILGRLDDRAAEVSLITYGDGAAVAVPLTRDFGAVSRAMVGLDAWGDTELSAGLQAALTELTGPKRDPQAHQVAVLLTDGVPKDDPQAAADRLLAAGVDVYVLVFPTREFDPAMQTTLEQVAGDPGHLFMSPVDDQLDYLVAGFTHYTPERGLFETIEINDVIPDNMTYVEGSAEPSAEHIGNTLTWRLSDVLAAFPIELTYELIPQEVGYWPTNVRAEAPYTDTLEARGNLVFPVPKVRVWDRGSLPFHAYLPAVFDKGCARKGPPADVVLVIDASVSMSDPAVGGGSKLEAAQAAAKGFLANLRPSDRAGVVSFNREAHRLSELTADRQALTAAIDGISISPGTVIDLGLQAATAELTGARPDASRAVILLTDGQNNQGPAAVVVAANGVKGTGALLFTVGLGDNIDRALLRQAASSPEQYFEAPDAAALKRIYEEIAATLPCAR